MFFRTNFQFKSFLAFFTINCVCRIKPLLWIRKNVLSRNTDNYKVWNKFWVIGNLLRWTPFVVFQSHSSPFLDHISSDRYLKSVTWGFAELWGLKNYKDRRILMKKTANYRKMATSFRRKKHQDERASEASDFLCTRFQMCTKHLEIVSTLRNHFMFIQMVVKKDTYSLSETEANWTRNCLFFFEPISSSRIFQHFSQSIAFAGSSHYYESGKNVLSRNTDNYKVWNKFWVIGNLLRWTPFVVLLSHSSPFLDHISSDRYLKSVICGFAGLWDQKNYKNRRILMKKTANYRKMATSFRRKKHQDERASEASDFLCTRFQMCTKHLETVSTLINHFMFLQMVGKKDTNSFSETEANWTRNCLFFSNQFPVQEFFTIFHYQSRLQDQAITMNQEKCVVSEYRQL